MPDVWLATCAAMPTGADEGPPLRAAFDRLGVDARWAVWDDPGVDWAAAPLVAVRTVWDYFHRREALLSWADRVAAATRLVNPAPVLRWNTHKAYLVELAGWGVPTVPTRALSAGESMPVSAESVAKPAVGGSGCGVRVQPAGSTVVVEDFDQVVQPLLASVRSHGELSVYVLGNAVVAAAAKHPAPGEIRVHEEYGGRTRPVALTPQMCALAEHAVSTAEERLGEALPYARCDLMRAPDGQLVVGELELVEPSLYRRAARGSGARPS